jgi:hypothetical protein
MSIITVKDWNDLKKELTVKGGGLPGVYKITRKRDGKVYIGQTGSSITTRIKQHIDNKHEGDSAKIDGAIQAEGWNAFTYEVEEAIPEATTVQLWYRETTLIDKYNSCANGFNKTRGNHINATFITLTTKHEVSVELTKYIRDHFKLDFTSKNVLLIGFFKTQFIDKLKYDNCTVAQINKVCDTDKEFAEYIMEEIKKYKGMKFDLIIANPPYGKAGANITKTIIKSIEFDDYINLLPANDYNRNDDKDLYKHVDLDTMKPVIKGFADAAVTTHMARITKKRHDYIAWEEFQIENYIDDSLTDYFYGNRKRNHYAIDEGNTWFIFADNDDIKKTILLDHRCIPNKHFAYSKTTYEYRWNCLENLSIADMQAENKSTSTPGKMNKYVVKLASEVEKKNIVDFIYSANGFRFISKVFRALNTDSTLALSKWFPKVDWTRSWTVEEILKDYGYTQKEIDEVIADLDNFKGMED